MIRPPPPHDHPLITQILARDHRCVDEERFGIDQGAAANRIKQEQRRIAEGTIEQGRIAEGRIVILKERQGGIDKATVRDAIAVCRRYAVCAVCIYEGEGVGAAAPRVLITV